MCFCLVPGFEIAGEAARCGLRNQAPETAKNTHRHLPKRGHALTRLDDGSLPVRCFWDIFDSLPFHVRKNLTKLLSGEAIETVGHCRNDSKAERLLPQIVQFRLRRV